MTRTMARLTPLHHQNKKLGARFAPVGDWLLAEEFGGLDAEVARAKQSVAIGDESSCGRVLIQGDDTAGFLSDVLAMASPPIGGCVAGESVYVCRLRQDQVFVITSPGKEAAMAARFEEEAAATGGLTTITDLTNGRAQLRLVGPASGELLSKVCGLDFGDAAFPNNRSKQSSLAKTNQLIVRRDMQNMPAYSIVGGRSLADYVWGVISEAGAEFGLAPIGRLGLSAL